MKYEEALQSKNLKVDDLAQQTQKKVKELHFMIEEIKEFEGQELDDEEKELFDEINKKIEDLDNYLFRAVMKFDKDIYEKRKEVFEQNRQKRILKNSNQEVEVVEPTASTTIEEKTEVEIQEVPKAKIVEEPKKKNVDINQKLEELKKEVSINSEKFKPEEEQQPEPIEVEAEEFEKKAERKPKKMSLGVILMCAGFGLLTFGAVNYFKERR